jgi:hypothetical protein
MVLRFCRAPIAQRIAPKEDFRVLNDSHAADYAS